MAACVKGGPPSLSWNNYNSVLEPPHCHQGDLSKSITDPDLPLVTPQPHLRGSHCPQDKGLGPQLKSEAFQGLGPMGLCSWFPIFGFPTFGCSPPLLTRAFYLPIPSLSCLANPDHLSRFRSRITSSQKPSWMPSSLPLGCKDACSLTLC